MDGEHSREPAGVSAAALVEQLGATVLPSVHEGVVDFDLDGVPGIAYLTGRAGATLRASFFLVFDPDPGDAQRWMDRNRPPTGTLQLLSETDRTVIRLLVEEPARGFTSVDAARIRHQVHALVGGWTGRAAGYRDLVDTLAGAGVACPPLGDTFPEEIRRSGPWWWTSGFLRPMDMYLFDVGRVARLLAGGGGVFALAHAGHGPDGYALNLVSTAGPVAAFVQHRYGNLADDPVEDLLTVNATYARLHGLFRGAGSAGSTRWLLLHSTLRGTLGVVDLDVVRRGGSPQEATETLATEDRLFETVAARV